MKLALISVLIVSPLCCFAEGLSNPCQPLLAFGTFDFEGSFTDRQRYDQVATVIRNFSIHTIQQAQQIESSTRIPILDILTVSFGSQINDSNIERAENSFLNEGYGQFVSRDQSASLLRSASAILANAYNECIRSTFGFSGYIVNSRDRERFIVHLQHTGYETSRFHIISLDIKPPAATCTDNAQNASKQNPFEIDGSFDIQCVKSAPERDLNVVVNTAEHGALQSHDGPTFELPGQKDSLTDIEDRISKLEARGVPAGTIAYFTSPQCPIGWRFATNVAGRYVVGSLGNGVAIGGQQGKAIDVANLENRPSGNLAFVYEHTAILAGPATPGHRCLAAIDGNWDDGGGVHFCYDPTTVQAVGGPAGTPAPYTVLNPCEKL